MSDLQPYYASASAIYSFFTAKGLTPEQACGVVAQADAESSMRVNVIGDKDHAFGLFQLHSDRVAPIKSKTGIDMKTATLEQQCEGVWFELHFSEKKALAALLATKTAFDAGHDLCRFYERPASTAQYQVRGDKAENWLAYFKKNPVTP